MLNGKPTRKDLLEAARKNPVVRAWLSEYQFGDLDFEEAMIGAVVSLAERNDALIEQAIDLYWRKPFIVTFGPIT